MLVWLCNQQSIAAQGIMQIPIRASLLYLLIFLRPYALRLIVMHMMILVALIDVGLHGMLSHSVLH